MEEIIISLETIKITANINGKELLRKESQINTKQTKSLSASKSSREPK